MTTFEDFYADYPRKEAKLAAMRAWAKAIKVATPEEIHEGLKNQLHVLTARERKFIPLPGTWLNGGRWMDELEEPKPDFRDRTKLPFDEWTQQDKRAAGDYLARAGAEKFLQMGYTQEHLDRLRGPVLVSDEGSVHARVMRKGVGI